MFSTRTALNWAWHAFKQLQALPTSTTRSRARSCTQTPEKDLDTYPYHALEYWIVGSVALTLCFVTCVMCGEAMESCCLEHSKWGRYVQWMDSLIIIKNGIACKCNLVSVQLMSTCTRGGDSHWGITFPEGGKFFCDKGKQNLPVCS
jgi:hypothetical protein